MPPPHVIGGHSVEQFRIYEAMETGSIPVIEASPATQLSLPPEYFLSPMLFVMDWEMVVDSMLDMVANATALLARQHELTRWYQQFMEVSVCACVYVCVRVCLVYEQQQ